MNINDAFNLLNIKSPATQFDIRKAYKAASLKYHPDRNLAGQQMMIAINSAYDLLKNLGDEVKTDSKFTQTNYAEALNKVLNELLLLDGLILEICGNWIWISGSHKKHKSKLGKNGLGCYWASKKKMWYYRPAEYKSSSRRSSSMESIRENYGSNPVFRTNTTTSALPA